MPTTPTTPPAAPAAPIAPAAPATPRSQPRRRTDTSLPGQLNTEWNTLQHTPTPPHWRTHPTLDHPTLAHIETTTRTTNPTTANTTLHTLLTHHHHPTHESDHLAGRTLLQLMLGKAIRLAATHTGRDTQHNLETLAITALWQTITTYPLDRRPTKIAANITMDTLNTITRELAHTHHETPTNPTTLHTHQTTHQTHHHTPPDLELLNLLTWAVDHHTITPADATLILDIYTPPPGQPGGPAAAQLHGLTWPTARQRASRAIRKITHTIHTDSAYAYSR